MRDITGITWIMLRPVTQQIPGRYLCCKSICTNIIFSWWETTENQCSVLVGTKILYPTTLSTLFGKQFLLRLTDMYSHWSQKTNSFFWLYLIIPNHLISKPILYFMYMDRVKRIWYLLPMRAAKVQASLRIRAVSPEPSLLAHTSSESRGTFIQKARSLAPLNGWACAVKVCHDGMLEDTNSLGGAHIFSGIYWMDSLIQGVWKITVSLNLQFWSGLFYSFFVVLFFL